MFVLFYSFLVLCFASPNTDTFQFTAIRTKKEYKKYYKMMQKDQYEKAEKKLKKEISKALKKNDFQKVSDLELVLQEVHIQECRHINTTNQWKRCITDYTKSPLMNEIRASSSVPAPLFLLEFRQAKAEMSSEYWNWFNQHYVQRSKKKDVVTSYHEFELNRLFGAKGIDGIVIFLKQYSETPIKDKAHTLLDSSILEKAQKEYDNNIEKLSLDSKKIIADIKSFAQQGSSKIQKELNTIYEKLEVKEAFIRRDLTLWLALLEKYQDSVNIEKYLGKFEAFIQNGVEDNSLEIAKYVLENLDKKPYYAELQQKCYQIFVDEISKIQSLEKSLFKNSTKSSLLIEMYPLLSSDQQEEQKEKYQLFRITMCNSITQKQSIECFSELSELMTSDSPHFEKYRKSYEDKSFLFSEKEEDWKMFLDQFPESSRIEDAKNQYYSLLWERTKEEDTIEVYESLLEIAPDHPHKLLAVQWLGKTYYDLYRENSGKKTEDSNQLLQKSCANQHKEGCVELGKYYEKKDPQKAVDAYTTSCSKSDVDSCVWISKYYQKQYNKTSKRKFKKLSRQFSVQSCEISPKYCTDFQKLIEKNKFSFQDTDSKIFALRMLSSCKGDPKLCNKIGNHLLGMNSTILKKEKPLETVLKASHTNKIHAPSTVSSVFKIQLEDYSYCIDTKLQKQLKLSKPLDFQQSVDDLYNNFSVDVGSFIGSKIMSSCDEAPRISVTDSSLPTSSQDEKDFVGTNYNKETLVVPVIDKTGENNSETIAEHIVHYFVSKDESRSLLSYDVKNMNCSISGTCISDLTINMLNRHTKDHELTFDDLIHYAGIAYGRGCTGIESTSYISNIIEHNCFMSGATSYLLSDEKAKTYAIGALEKDWEKILTRRCLQDNKLTRTWEKESCQIAENIFSGSDTKQKSIQINIQAAECKRGTFEKCYSAAYAYLNDKKIKDVPKALDLFRVGCKGNDVISCTEGFRYYFNKNQSSDLTIFYANRACSLGEYEVCSYLSLLYWNQKYDQRENKDKIYKFAQKGCSKKSAFGCYMLALHSELIRSPETAKKHYKKSCALGYEKGCKKIYRQSHRMYFPLSYKTSSSYGTSQLISVKGWKSGAKEYIRLQFKNGVPKIEFSSREEKGTKYVTLTLRNTTGVYLKDGMMKRSYPSNSVSVSKGRLVRKAKNIGNKDGSPYGDNLEWEIELRKNKSPSLFVYESREKPGELVIEFSK